MQRSDHVYTWRCVPNLTLAFLELFPVEVHRYNVLALPQWMTAFLDTTFYKSLVMLPVAHSSTQHILVMWHV